MPAPGRSALRGTVACALRASQPGCYDFDPDQRLVRCPWHGWEYDLTTGQSYYNPRRKVRSYPVSVEPGTELTAAEGLYVAETFPISVEDDYVVIEP